MILVTGATGFVGRSVLRRLDQAGLPFRILLRPTRRTPDLPAGISMQVSLASLSDRRGVRAALVGVDSVIHLAGAERHGSREELILADMEGTRALAEAAAEAGVRRLIFLSHLGSDRASAYPVLRAKAVAEEFLRASGVPTTILRSAAIFGPGDRLTTGLAMALATLPGFFPVPRDPAPRLQPVWIEDLSFCLTWALEESELIGQTVEVGGPEYLSIVEVTHLVMKAAGLRRRLVPLRAPYLRLGAWAFERLFPHPPVTRFWFDYLAADRTTDLNTMPHTFGLQPARMEGHVDYLRGRSWAREMLSQQRRTSTA